MKVTKAMIKKELRELKFKQISKMRNERNQKAKELKVLMMSNYDNLINEITKQATKLGEITDKLEEELIENEELKPYLLEITSKGRLMRTLKESNSLKQYLTSNIDYSKSSVEKNINKMNEEITEVSNEWDKLLIQIDNLTLKETKDFLNENKIDLECMKEKQVTTLVVQDVKLNKLCF